MTNRTLVSYKKLYALLRQAIGATRPVKIVLDMEVAAYKAFLQVFHTEGILVAVTFCLFHFRKAVLGKLGKYHCKEEAKSGPFSKLVSRICCLPFVPAEHIITVAEDLLVNFINAHLPKTSLQACNWIDYFRKTYVGTYDEMKDARKPPVYQPNLWSVYDAVLNSEPHTTNYAEARLLII